MTFVSHVTTTKKKTWEKARHAQDLLPVRATSGQGLFRLRDFVTSGQKAPLWRIWRHFRLRMRRTYFRTGPLPDKASSSHVTLSLPVKRLYQGGYVATSGCACAEHTSRYGHLTDVTSGHVTSGCSTASLHLNC